jgi:arylsulfatase A-like enzyme
MRLSLWMVFALACPAFAGAQQGAQARRPNILFIAVDDLRPTLGAYGDTVIKTPNIDRLARSGVVFLDAQVQQAVCNASRASLMTGLRPDSLRVWDLRTDFRVTTPGAVTIPQYFRQYGYRAVSVGKIYHNVLPDSLSWSEPEYKVPGFPYDPDAVYRSPENIAIQEARKATIIQRGQQARSIDQFGLWYLKANATESVDLPDSVYYDGAQTDYAVRRLGELRDAGQPFFFAVGYYRPHLPFNAPQKYWDLYDPATLPLADNQFVPDGAPLMAVNTNKELRGYSDFRNAPEPNEGSLDVPRARRLTHGYYASISYVDAQVGRLLDRLDSLGLTDNTIVVLWGDHGYKLGEHNGWAKFTDYDIDTHAPLIIRAPGRIPPGLRLPQMVEFVDIYPTLAELAGLPVPVQLQGVSAAPLFRQPARAWKGATFSQFLRNGIWVAPDSIPYMGYSMRTADYHYVAWMNWDTHRYVAWELYDRRRDPDENVNLAGRPEHATLLARLEAERLVGWRAVVPGQDRR